MPVILKRMLVARVAPFVTRLRRGDLFERVRTLCLFVGHGRSGGTLVGALLNAHRNCVITNELDALDYVAKGVTQEQLFNLIYYVDKRLVRKGSTGGGGYTYAVPTQWQGRHDDLLVIGDSKAGPTAKQVMDEPERLSRLRQAISVDVRFVSVVRNPYDNITTTFRKTIRHPGEAADSHLRRQIDMYFKRCASVQRVSDEYGSDKLTRVHSEDLIGDARGALSRLCGFLDLDAPEDYLDDCAKIVFDKPHVTRESDEWTPGLIDLVAEKMADFPWLARYSFKTSA